MTGSTHTADTAELAAALRQWRERLSPADVGLPAGLRRRTPGLRREELAQLAGLSVDYVVRLEQDRAPRPSDTVLNGLSRALRLAPAETEHLFALAGVARPGPGVIGDTVRPSVLRLLDRMRDLPAILANARGDWLAWNAMATALIGDLSVLPPQRRTHLWLQFGAEHDEHGFVHRLVVEGEEGLRLDRAAVADARTALARYPHDQRLRAVVAHLRRTSPRFAALWAGRPLGVRRSDTKSYDVPGVGRITLDCECLTVPDDDQRLIVYSAPPNSSEASKLDLIRTIGLQAV